MGALRVFDVKLKFYLICICIYVGQRQREGAPPSERMCAREEECNFYYEVRIRIDEICFVRVNTRDVVYDERMCILASLT